MPSPDSILNDVILVVNFLSSDSGGNSVKLMKPDGGTNLICVKVIGPLDPLEISTYTEKVSPLLIILLDKDVVISIMIC
jgi:hypothetical protein